MIKKNDFVTCVGEGDNVFKVVWADESIAILVDANNIFHGNESIKKLNKVNKKDVKKSIRWYIDL